MKRIWTILLVLFAAVAAFAETFTLTYDLGEGATYPDGLSNPETFTPKDESFTLVKPIRDGYQFLGWIRDDDKKTIYRDVTIEKGSGEPRKYTAVWLEEGMLGTGKDGMTEKTAFEIANFDALKYLSKHKELWAYRELEIQNITYPYKGYYFKQTADIDGKTEAFAPIGTSTSEGSVFYGVYDGAAHVIKNMKIENISGYAGIFGYAKNATIKNLGVYDIDISATGLVGGIVGKLSGTSEISNCFARVDISAEGSSSDASMSAAGAIAGEVEGNTTVENVYAKGCIVDDDISNDKNLYIGGLVGKMTKNDDYAPTLTSAWTTMTFGETYNKNAGRIVGYSNGGEVSNVYFEENGNGNGDDYVDEDGNYTYMNVYAKSEITIDTAGMKKDFIKDMTGDALKQGLSSDNFTFVPARLPILTVFNSNEYAKKTVQVGDGSVENPYLIGTAEDLKWLSENSELWNSDNWIEQVADIDASSLEGFNPIGENLTTPFGGHYDGNGHVVRNLTDSPKKYAGLFGYVAGNISNLGVVASSMSGDTVGAIAGANKGTIENCFSIGNTLLEKTTDQKDDRGAAGGIVGVQTFGNLKNSYAVFNTIRGNSDLGELIGRFKEGSIKNLYFDNQIALLEKGIGNDDESTANGVTTSVLISTTFDGEVFKVDDDHDHYPTPVDATELTKFYTLALNLQDGDNVNSVESDFTPGKMDNVTWSIEEADAPASIEGDAVTISGYGVVTLKATYEKDDVHLERSFELTTYKSLKRNADWDYIIASDEDLRYVTMHPNYWNKNFVQTEDIDLSSIANFEPIGNTTTQFTGSYDGKGHIIANLNIDREDENFVGLFGYVDNGEIKNLGVLGNVKGKDNVGLIVGSARNGSITNSYATGSISGSTGVGAIAGVSKSTISNAYAVATVSGTEYVGALVGGNGGNISNSYYDKQICIIDNGVGTGLTTVQMTADGFAQKTLKDAESGESAFSFMSSHYPMFNTSSEIEQFATLAVILYFEGNVVDKVNAVGHDFNVATMYGVVWSGSSDVLSIDEDGKVALIKNGAATLTAEFKDGDNVIASREYTLNVEAKPFIEDILDPVFTHGDVFNIDAPNVTFYETDGGTSGWQISASGDNDDYQELTSGTAMTRSMNGYRLRYAATNSKGTSYSNVVQITVNKKPVRIAGIQIQAKTYDATTNATVESVTLNNDDIVDAEVVVVDMSKIEVEFSNKSAGTDKAVSINSIALTGEDADNYEVSDEYPEVLGTITSKELTIGQVIIKDKSYDGEVTAKVKRFVLNGVIEGDDVVIDTTGVVASFDNANAGENKSVSIETSIDQLKIIGADGGNYKITGEYPDEILGNILPADPVVTAPQIVKNLIYDGTDQALVKAGSVSSGATMLYSLVKDGTYTEDIPTGKNVDDYVVWYKAEATDNYKAVESASVTVSIEPKTVTVAAMAATKTYGDKDSAFTYNVTGLLDGDKLSGALSRESGENAGTYAIALGTLSVGGNYIIDFTAAKLTIEKATGVGSVTLADWTLGEDVPTPVVKSETNGTKNVTFEYKQKGAKDSAYSSKVPTEAGEYTVRATFAATKNYTEAVATADFTVKEKSTNIANVPQYAAAIVRSANGLITVENAENARVTVMNSLGKTLYIGRGNANVNVPSGLYLVQVGGTVSRVRVK